MQAYGPCFFLLFAFFFVFLISPQCFLKIFYFTSRDFQAVFFTKALILFALYLQAGALGLCTNFFFPEFPSFPFLHFRGFFFRFFRFCDGRGSFFSYRLCCDGFLRLG